MKYPKVFKNRKRAFWTLLVSLGLLVAGGVFFVFYISDPDSVREAFKHVFGRSETSAPFTLPTRERTSTPGEGKGEGEGEGAEVIQEWFASFNVRFHSAVLIAGSNGYGNYRHQADVCHAFQILKKAGMASDQIITFVYDDIAHNSRNPYPGQIFNKPGGEDVYQGCAKDYVGEDVNKWNVLAVLKGEARSVAGVGSGRVLKHDASQKIFLYYSDHGNVGSIAMPYGPPLFANVLHNTLNSLINKNAFDEMLIYLEACESGSMFRGFGMDKQSKILAVSASDAFESSYATYCPDYGYQTRIIEPNATFVGACLGDLFSVAWMEDTEERDLGEDLVEEQVDDVRERTSDQGTYIYGSHVKLYGDSESSIGKQVLGNFLSYYAVPTGWRRSDGKSSDEHEHFIQSEQLSGIVHETMSNNHEDVKSEQFARAYDQRQADLMYLYHAAYKNGDEEASRALVAEIQRRSDIDMKIRAIIQHLIDEFLPADSSVEAYATTEVHPPENGQVVDDWSCLREVDSAWEEYCHYPLRDYAGFYTRAFANLCNAGLTSAQIVQSFFSVC